MFFKHLIAKLRSESGQAGVATVDENESGAGQPASQSGQAEKLEGLIADIDLSDVPETMRGEVKKYLSEKVKQYDAGYRSKTEDLSKDRKTLEEQRAQVKELVTLKNEVDANPALSKKINQVINQARAGILKDDEAQANKSLKTLDNLIENTSDLQTRESLRQMRAIIKEETAHYSSYADQLKAVQNELAALKNATLTGQAERVDIKMKQLEDKFGKDIVNKYREDVTSSAMKYPNQTVEKLLFHYASEDEIETAILARAEARRKKEEQRKEEGSSIPGRTVHSPAEVKRDKFGRVIWKDFFKGIGSS